MRDQQVSAAERWYLRQLLRLVKQIRLFAAGTKPDEVDMLSKLLNRYAEAIQPWAERIAAGMIAEVSRRDKIASVSEIRAARIENKNGRSVREYLETTRQDKIEARNDQSVRMYGILKKEMATSEVGVTFRSLQAKQADLIVGLPKMVSEKLQQFISGAAFSGLTPKEVQGEIMRISGVSESRARLIARTETSRAFAQRNQALSMGGGSTHYRWMAARDNDVRLTHRKLNGNIFAWNSPPVSELDGTHHHPGEAYNCRCVAIALFGSPPFPPRVKRRPDFVYRT